MPTSAGAGPLVTGLVEIRTTFASRDAAMACAEQLVRERLAACVQVEGPVTSTYSWNGAVEQAEEWRCACKTTRTASNACIAAIVRGHGYDIPQVVVIPVEVTPAYAAWVNNAMGPA